jgi:hypothetical protein
LCSILLSPFFRVLQKMPAPTKQSGTALKRLLVPNS